MNWFKFSLICLGLSLVAIPSMAAKSRAPASNTPVCDRGEHGYRATFHFDGERVLSVKLEQVIRGTPKVVEGKISCSMVPSADHGDEGLVIAVCSSASSDRGYIVNLHGGNLTGQRYASVQQETIAGLVMLEANLTCH